MKRVVFILCALLLVSSVAMADLYTWQIKCGLDGNVPPYGNDFSTRFGVAPTGTWNNDGDDATHPTINDAEHDVGFVYDKGYTAIYVSEGYGWPPSWDPTAGTPVYPNPGLIKDTRAPILESRIDQPEFWMVKLQAPNAGSTVKFVWSINDEAGYEIPLDKIYVKILNSGNNINAQLESIGIVGDYYLTGQGTGYHELTGIQQWGYNYDDGFAIKKTWKIEAGVIPEPGTIVLMAGGLVGMAGLIRRKK